MTDVEAKIPPKRKNSYAQNKKGSAKKAKLDNIKTPQKNISPKQKFNKKNKKNSESENDSPKKLKPFPGTQATGVKVGKKAKEIEKKGGTEGGEKKKKRRSQFRSIGLQIKSDDKQAAIKTIESKLEEIQSRGELSKTAKKKIKLLQKLKKIAEGQALGQPQQKSLEKKNSKKQTAGSSLQKKESVKAVQQSNDVKTNGKANKNLKVQNKKAAQKTIPQKQVEDDEEDSDDDIEGESDDSEQDVEDESENSGEEEEIEDESDEEDEDEGECNEEEDDNPPSSKVSNKKQKKK